MSIGNFDSAQKKAPAIIGDRKYEPYLLVREEQGDDPPKRSHKRQGDPFAGHSYEDVCRLHFPLGVQTYESIVYGKSGPKLEFVCAKPANGPEFNDKMEYDPELAVVMLAPFINPVSDGKGNPNHIALRAAAIADGANADVMAFGHPSIVGDGMPRKVRKEMADADYSFIANEIAKAVKAQGKKRAIVYGYSQGGELAPDIALALHANGIEVVGVISVAPPGVVNRPMPELGKDFSEKTGMPTVKQEIARLGSVAMNQISEGNFGLLSLSKIPFNTARLTSIAMARGYSKGKFTEKILNMAKILPEALLLLAASTNDKVCPLNDLANTCDLLKNDGADVTLFEMRAYDGDNGHAWGDYITDQAALVALSRREWLLRKANSGF